MEVAVTCLILLREYKAGRRWPERDLDGVLFTVAAWALREQGVLSISLEEAKRLRGPAGWLQDRRRRPVAIRVNVSAPAQLLNEQRLEMGVVDEPLAARLRLCTVLREATTIGAVERSLLAACLAYRGCDVPNMSWRALAYGAMGAAQRCRTEAHRLGLGRFLETDGYSRGRPELDDSRYLNIEPHLISTCRRWDEFRARESDLYIAMDLACSDASAPAEP